MFATRINMEMHNSFEEQDGTYPSRRDMIWALFGYMPSSENTVSFDSRDRRRAEIIQFSTCSLKQELKDSRNSCF
jgi:hypothetical protein